MSNIQSLRRFQTESHVGYFIFTCTIHAPEGGQLSRAYREFGNGEVGRMALHLLDPAYAGDQGVSFWLFMRLEGLNLCMLMIKRLLIGLTII
jgi:hypothetical protein